jgi:hypothetical protein
MRTHLGLITLLSIVTALIVVACGSSGTPVPEYPPDPQAENGATTVEVERVDVAPQPEPQEAPPPPVQVVAGENSPLEGAMPSLRITAPRNGAKVARSPVQVRATLRNWVLAADPGNHVHFIVDDEPYMAVRDLSQPVDLSALVQTNLGHELAPGTHVLRAFASRGQHESIKDAGAFQVLTFVYQTPTPNFAFNVTAPLLTYSRPKGCAVVGQRVLLDFFVANTTLAADGVKVHYAIDDAASGDIVTWAPHYIENLPLGEHRIHLTLVGADGQPLPGMFNDVTHTITVADSCDAPAAGAMPDMPMGH